MTTTHTDDTRELDAYVRERALNTVVINLAPAPFLMVPFVLLVGTVLRNETSPVRIGWWTIAAVIATAINLTALGAYKKHRENTPGQPAGRAITFMLGAGVTALGTFLGMSPWAAADGPLELVLLFLLFPATASAVGCIVTAGRRDFYLAYLVPLVILSAASLYTADDQRLRPLSLMAAFFGAGLMLLHHVVSRGSIEAYRLQWQSDQLLAQLDEERAELTSLNEQLAGTNTRLAHQATHAPLTGLYNRRGTLDLLDQMLAEADEEHPLGVLFCDLDHFKEVNDRHGHALGDACLLGTGCQILEGLELTSGTVVGAGANASGEVGDATTTARNQYTAASVVTTAVAVTAGGKAHSLALRADGQLYSWGDNAAKQLGIASLAATGTSTPTLVPGFDATP